MFFWSAGAISAVQVEFKGILISIVICRWESSSPRAEQNGGWKPPLSSGGFQPPYQNRLPI